MANEGQGGLAAKLRRPTTPALANYLCDHFAMIGFQAYLWKMVVTADYRNRDPQTFPAPGDPTSADSAVGQMQIHSRYLGEMIFCRGVNSFQTYIAGLMTMIFEARPDTLKSEKKVTREFCVEHYAANDLISALAEQTVSELAYQSLKDLAKFFDESLGLPLFAEPDDLEKAALQIDIRNIITHNRGIINSFFVQRHAEYADAIGHPISMNDSDVSEKLGTLVYHSRQLDARAIEKFGLRTLAVE